MGANVYITTDREANFEGLNKERVVDVGEKVGNQYVYYWRDSYNVTNLAWAVGMDYGVSFENNPIRFLERLAESTDGEIEEGYKRLCRRFGVRAEKRVLEFLKEKRNYLKRIVEAGIVSVEHSI